eukprot:202710-Karenia_brevis.AAC.1
MLISLKKRMQVHERNTTKRKRMRRHTMRLQVKMRSAIESKRINRHMMLLRNRMHGKLGWRAS